MQKTLSTRSIELECYGHIIIYGCMELVLFSIVVVTVNLLFCGTGMGQTRFCTVVREWIRGAQYLWLPTVQEFSHWPNNLNHNFLTSPNLGILTMMVNWLCLQPPSYILICKNNSSRDVGITSNLLKSFWSCTRTISDLEQNCLVSRIKRVHGQALSFQFYQGWLFQTWLFKRAFRDMGE